MNEIETPYPEKLTNTYWDTRGDDITKADVYREAFQDAQDQLTKYGQAEYERGVIHCKFWCNLCEKYIPNKEIEMSDHYTTGAMLFSHKGNHLLEVRESLTKEASNKDNQ